MLNPLAYVPLKSRYGTISPPYHSTAMSGPCFHVMLVMGSDTEPGDRTTLSPTFLKLSLSMAK